MSNLSAIEYVTSPSALTTGLFNQRYSVISANFAALNSDVTLNVGSGNTVSIQTNLNVIGGAHFQFISVGSTPPSYVTTAAITVEVNSAYSDYLYFIDSSAQKSNYVIGSRAGGLADGLNIWDASAETMIASFSKQSIRFFQNVVGPVFDVGGALADTYNAGTFGNGSQSIETRIQAAINQAVIDGVSRVYVPASMYPYSSSSVSFNVTVQMVREGGAWDVWDVIAYGAAGDNTTDDRNAVQSCISQAALAKGPVLISRGTFFCSDGLQLPTNSDVFGQGYSSVLRFSHDSPNYNTCLRASGTTSSRVTNVKLRNFTIMGPGTGGPAGSGNQPAGVNLSRTDNFEVSGMHFYRVKGISLAYQGSRFGRIFNNLVEDGGRDGITGYFELEDIVVANNTITRVGDDYIAINATVSTYTLLTARPQNIEITGNTINGYSANTTNLLGRGIQVMAVQNCSIIGNTVTDSFAGGIVVTQSDESAALGCNGIIVANNVVRRAGQPGDGSQNNEGIRLSNVSEFTITGNVVSDSSQHGIYVVSSMMGTIVGNVSDSNSTIRTGSGIFLDGTNNSVNSVKHVIVANNLCRRNGGDGIRASFGDNIVIRGNQCLNNSVSSAAANDFMHGIRIQEGTAWIVEGNISTDTGTAANAKTQQDGIRILGGSAQSIIVSNNFLSSNSRRAITLTSTPAAFIKTGNIESSHSDLFPGTSQLTDGTSAAPAYTFITEPTTLGWYRSGIAHLGLVGSLALGTGSAVTPGYAFSSESSLGIYRSGVSTMGLSYGALVVPDGSSTTPSIGYSSNTSLGFYSFGVRTIAQSYGTFNLATNSVRLSMRTLAASSVTASAAKTNVAVDEVVFTIGGASGASLIIYSGGTAYGFNSAFSAAAS